MSETKRFQLYNSMHGALAAIYPECHEDFQYLVSYLKTAKLFVIMLRSRRDASFLSTLAHTTARGQRAIDEITRDPALNEIERVRRVEKIQAFVSDLRALDGKH